MIFTGSFDSLPGRLPPTVLASLDFWAGLLWLAISCSPVPLNQSYQRWGAARVTSGLIDPPKTTLGGLAK